MRIAVVEDELTGARRLIRLCQEILGDAVQSIQHWQTIDDARDALVDQRIDLLFLDLDLDGQDGFDVLRSTAAAAFHTIIVSAHADRAIEAFEYGVLDFVAKPYGKARVEKALQRIRARAEQGRATRYVSVKKTHGIELIEVGSLTYIRGAGNYSELVDGAGAIHLHEKNLEKLLPILPPDFERVHKSYIVNIRQVVRINSLPGSRYDLLLRNGESLPVGRSRIKALRARVSGRG